MFIFAGKEAEYFFIRITRNYKLKYTTKAIPFRTWLPEAICWDENKEKFLEKVLSIINAFKSENK